MNDIEPEKTAANQLKLSGIDSGEFSWGTSLLLKCAFLGASVGFIYWVGWPQPTIPAVSMPSMAQSGSPSSSTLSSGSTGHTHNAAPVSSLREKEFLQPLPLVADGEIGQTGESTAFVVDLNDGTSAELEHLPGIGAVLAERIVAHRVSHGAFRQIEDLILVPGIGEKRFQQVRPFVGVRAAISGMGS